MATAWVYIGKGRVHGGFTLVTLQMERPGRASSSRAGPAPTTAPAASVPACPKGKAGTARRGLLGGAGVRLLLALPGLAIWAHRRLYVTIGKPATTPRDSMPFTTS